MKGRWKTIWFCVVVFVFKLHYLAGIYRLVGAKLIIQGIGAGQLVDVTCMLARAVG